MINASDTQYTKGTKAVSQSNSDDDAPTPYTSPKPIKLGDFSKLFNEFLTSTPKEPTPILLEDSSQDEGCSPSPATTQTTGLSSTVLKHDSDQSSRDTRQAVHIKDAFAKRSHANTNNKPPCDIKSILVNERKTKAHHGSTSSASTRLTATSQYVSCRNSIHGREHRLVGQPISLTTPFPECPECALQASAVRLRSRQRTNKLSSSLPGPLRVNEDKHRALLMDLVPHRVRDAIVAGKYPDITSRGVHVFIDMSNINIGFQTTLKERRFPGRATRMSPLPNLNLQFLTDILVRDRQVAALNVCCSTIPGRSEPEYVQRLRELGYHIDLRERKRVDGGHPSHKTSDHLRYVEDLVDETLQVRIAESVMEYFHEPGTIVLATGDAKPSVHSDGFFSYMHRALRMGWHVEVVSWRDSLSLRWTDKQWTSQWHDKFRVIELDEFLENLE